MNQHQEKYTILNLNALSLFNKSNFLNCFKNNIKNSLFDILNKANEESNKGRYNLKYVILINNNGLLIVNEYIELFQEYSNELKKELENRNFMIKEWNFIWEEKKIKIEISWDLNIELIISTSQGQKICVNVHAETTIGELKKMIEIKEPCFKVENQQIIYNGNILSDDEKVGRKTVLLKIL